MKRNILLKIVTSLSLSALLFSCDIPDVGFFSEEGIEMREDTLIVVKGIEQTSALPYTDGSTLPILFEFVQVTDLVTGEISSDFLQVFPIKMWRKPYNGLEDTTLSLVNEKLYDTLVNPLLINPRSGQLKFNSTTLNIESGLYGVDVRATNSKSSKIFENYGIIKLQLIPWQLPVPPSDAFRGFTVDNKSINIAGAAYTTSEQEQVKNNTHPLRSLYKVGELDIVELELVLKDAEGTALPPQALIRWYNDNGVLNNYHLNSVALDASSGNVTYTDTSCIFRFPNVPYPGYSSSYTGDNAYLTYYNIDPKYWGPTDKYQIEADKLGQNFKSYTSGFRNGYKINETGKWLMTVNNPFIKYNGYKE